jgi:hypothetical protein
MITSKKKVVKVVKVVKIPVFLVSFKRRAGEKEAAMAWSGPAVRQSMQTQTVPLLPGV